MANRLTDRELRSVREMHAALTSQYEDEGFYINPHDDAATMRAADRTRAKVETLARLPVLTDAEYACLIDALALLDVHQDDADGDATAQSRAAQRRIMDSLQRKIEAAMR
jgi:hypothetical protein